MASVKLHKPTDESCHHGNHENTFPHKITEMATRTIKTCTERKHEEHHTDHATAKKQTHGFGQTHDNQIKQHASRGSACHGKPIALTDKKKHENKKDHATICKPKTPDHKKKEKPKKKKKTKDRKSGDSSSSSSSSSSSESDDDACEKKKKEKKKP